MRELGMGVAAGLMVLLCAGAAGALPYAGTLQIDVGELGAFSLPGSGEGVSTSTTVSIGSPGPFATTTSIPITTRTPGGDPDTPLFPIVNLAITGPAGLTEATFQEGAAPDGGFGGNAPLAGNALIGLFGPPPVTFLTVPLQAFGSQGATTVATSTVLGVTVTVFGGGWTTGQARVIGTTGPFFGQLLAEATGRDDRTPGGLGTIVLVTPTRVRTNVAGSENIPLIGTLTLNFVPEPGTLLLVGSGLAALALARRRSG